MDALIDQALSHLKHELKSGSRWGLSLYYIKSGIDLTGTAKFCLAVPSKCLYTAFEFLCMFQPKMVNFPCGVKME